MGDSVSGFYWMIRLFRVYVPVGTLTLLISEIILLATAFFVACYVVLPFDPSIFLFDEGGWMRISLVIASLLIGLYFYDLYTDLFVKSRIVLLQQLCLIIGSAFLLQGFISYVNINLRVPIRVMVLGNLLSVVAIFCWRILFSTYAIQMVNRDSLLLVGGSLLLEDIGRHIHENPETGLSVAGYLDDGEDTGRARPGGKVMGDLSALEEVVAAVRPTRIVVGMRERRNRMPVAALLELRFAGYIIEEAAVVYERISGRVQVKELHPSQLIYSGELGPGVTICCTNRFSTRPSL